VNGTGGEAFAVRGKLVLGGSLQDGAVIVESGRISGISRSARRGSLMRPSFRQDLSICR
jgi:hypothetical protein